MNLPAAIAADQALVKQNVALSTIKSSAEADQAIAGILEQSARSAPVSSIRGTNVNTSA
jgi:hypothetical protein